MESARIKFTLLLVFIFCLCVSLLAEKHALLIAIGDYPEESGWHDISSANDLNYIQPLLGESGFDENNIIILRDAEATYSKIIKSFKNLTNRVNKADIVYLHISSHGQQVVDDNGDEIDNLDEAIVPYDSPRNYIKDTYEGHLLIRDDQIKQMLYEIRIKLGEKGQIVFLMDSCHSGTGTRGRGKSRGTNAIMGPTEINSNKDILQASDNTNDLIDVSETKDIAPLIALYGSGPHELNYEFIDQEGISVGSLTYAFSKILHKYGSSISSEELFERIRLKMLSIAPAQKPMFEGDGSLILFGNKQVQRKKYYSISKFESARLIEANIGYLQGFEKGEVIEVWHLNENRAITKGHIIDLGLTKSYIELDDKIETDVDILYKVKKLGIDLSGFKTTVSIRSLSSERWGSVLEGLRTSKLFDEKSNEAELYLGECEANESLELITKEGDIIYEGAKRKSDDYHLYKISNHIKAYAQSKFLREIHAEANGYQLELTLINLNDKKEDEIKVEKSKTIQLAEGDEIKLKIKNTGKKPAYYAILDIQPDHRISVMVPGGNLKAADFYIQPGETQILNYTLKIYPPYGVDVLKIIATDQPIDIESIVKHEGQVRGESKDLHPLEALFKFSYQDEETRSNTASSLEYNWDSSIESFIYEVVPKK